MQHHQANPAVGNPASGSQPSSLRLEVIEQRLHALQETVASSLNTQSSAPFTGSLSLDDLSSMKEEIRLLKQQIGGSGGFKSMLETRVAASMQNFFPAPFGKTSGDKLDDNETLPGISDPDKFDNGSTGVKYKILQGMKDVSMQLETNIEKVLKDYPDAKQMARDMLLNAKRFVIDLMNYMSQDYFSWKLRGYTKREAWKMTCRSVHRVLDDLQGARMSGRDTGDGADTDRVTATYIWATAKTHEVMDEYLKYKFFEYPAIAAVLACHLAATAVLPDDQLPAKVRALEQTLTKLSSKVDSLESKQHTKSAKFVEMAPVPALVSPTPSPSILRSKNAQRGGHN
jgi:hypothetical protein